MPLYEYQCEACGRRFEKIVKFSDKPLEICELCGKGPVHKLMSSPAIQFKGSGFYITDYPKKGSTGTTDSSSSSNGGGSSEKTDKPAEKKTETKSTETKSTDSKSTDSKSTDSTPKNS
jgi:putative FmdB family regulatory protein